MTSCPFNAKYRLNFEVLSELKCLSTPLLLLKFSRESRLDLAPLSHLLRVVFSVSSAPTFLLRYLQTTLEGQISSYTLSEIKTTNEGRLPLNPRRPSALSHSTTTSLHPSLLFPSPCPLTPEIASKQHNVSHNHLPSRS